MVSEKQQVFELFDLLTDRNQFLICELIKSLAQDDIATPEDIAAHVAACRDYRNGDAVRFENINWS